MISLSYLHELIINRVTMGIDVVVFIFGAILLSTGLWGGGVTIRDLSVPKIGLVPRVTSIGMGIFIILIGISLNESFSDDFSHITESSPDSGDALPVSPPPEVDEVSSSIVDRDQDFKDQVEQQLLLLSEDVGLWGYELTHDPYLGRLEDNTEEQITLELLGGINYGIVVVCDEDCGDVDLELYDESGNLIDSDNLTDDRPFIEVEPQWDGPFTLNVIMPSCKAPYCYYGIGAFGQLD